MKKLPFFKSKSIKLSFVLILFLVAHSTVEAQRLNLKQVWTNNSHSFLESAPTLADINNDGKDEVLIAGREELIVLQKQGKELWRWNTRKRFITYPTVLKRNGKSSLIYIADNSGLMTCLDGTGKVIWQAELNDAAEWSAGAVADLDNDGIPELVQTDIKGTVWIFNALSGKVIQSLNIKGKPSSPSLGDLDDDGKMEIVIATNEGFIYAITYDGEIKWKTKLGGFSETWATSSPVIYAASDSKSYIAAASSSGDFYCLNQNGQIKWKQHTNGPVASTISVGDFDQNGIADIFTITQLGVIYRFDESGNILWDIDMQGRSLAPGAIIDINNDGKLEYILSTQQGNLLALDNKGDVIFNHQFNNRTINVTPAFGDVYGSSKDIEMVLSGGESGITFCFDTPSSTNAISHWTSYRGNHQNKGSWFGLTQSDNLRMIPTNLSWNKVFTGENIIFNIYNPVATKELLNASASCIRPDGSKQKGISKVIGKTGQLQLPVSFDIPGVYKFSWSLTNSNDHEMITGKKEITILPLSNEEELTAAAINKLESISQTVSNILPLSAKALEEQKMKLETKAESLGLLGGRNQFSDDNAAKQSIAKLIKDVKRASTICDIIEKAAELGPSTSLIAFEGHKWDSRNVDLQLPQSISSSLKLSHDVVPGEHHPVPLILFNITNQILQVKVDFEQPNDIKITPLYSALTLSSLGNNSWDAMPEMDESGLISIPPLSSREVWLDLNLENTKPGLHSIEINVYALNGAGVVDAPDNPHAVPAPNTKVELSLNVLQFKMGDAKDFRLCTWSPSTGPELEDLLNHGNNVFIIPQGKIEYKGNELVNINFTEIETIIDQFKETDVFLLSYGLPKIKAEFGTESFNSDYMKYLEQMIKFLESKEIDKDHFALYAIDEPGGHGWNSVNTIVTFGKLVHSSYPDVMIYMDGGGEVPMFKAMAEVIDVWVPPFDWLPEDIPEMDIMRSVGKNLWSYNCTYSTSRPVGPNVKNINIPYEFRTAALMAFSKGANGIGYWCYNANRENPWMRIKNEYNLVYPGRTKPITSRRWEAVREGIEDYRIMAALEDYVNNSESNTLNKETKRRIEHLINVCLPELVDGGFQVMKIGLSREAIDLVSNETKINIFRKEMMECVKLITEKNLYAIKI